MATIKSQMRLYSRKSERLYINRAERKAFKQAAKQQTTDLKLLCLVLFYTGCRLSEALNLRLCDFQVEDGNIAITSLKKRDKHHVREIPVPYNLLREVEQHFKDKHTQLKLWPIHRSTAWRKIKRVMEQAGIEGAQATAKGLRHSFGANCVYLGIDIDLCKKWMGHSTIAVTAIYRQIVGKEEREIASRIWK